MKVQDSDLLYRHFQTTFSHTLPKKHRHRARRQLSSCHIYTLQCHSEAAAGFRQVNSQPCFLLSRHICLLMCVYHIYREAVTTSGPMTTSGKELTLLVLHCTPSPPHLSSVLTTTAGSNQSVTSELRCNKSQPPPTLLPFFLPLLLSSLSSLVVFRSRPQQQKTAGLQQASRLSPPPSPSTSG